MRWKDIVFDGYRGFEDHQRAKEEFFDPEHKLCSIEVKLDGDDAIANTKITWRERYRPPRAAKSEVVFAEVKHTWTLRKKADKVLLMSQEVKELKIIEGELPKYLQS